MQDDEIDEVILDDEDEEGDSDVGDEDDDECPGDVSFNMTGKEDPDFSPGIDALKKEAAALPTRRSSRLVIPFFAYDKSSILSPPSQITPLPLISLFRGRKLMGHPLC